MLRSRLPLLLLVFALSGCAVESRFGAATLPSDGGGVDAGEDRDHDGVCDSTERTIGSNPDELDSDHDGFPDAIELLNAFDPIDPNSPGVDQVAFMPAKNDASIELALRATVDGQGESFTGVLSSYPSIDAQKRSADDFLSGVVAVAAEPPENVHAVDASAERFDAVVGHTRLSFRAGFHYTSNVDFPCAEGFAFAYALKSDQGKHVGSRDYMIVITPKDAMGRDPKSFCLPAACL